MKKTLLLFLGTLLTCLSAKAQPAEFARYYQSFKKLGTLVYISQEWLETNPHQKLKPMKPGEGLHWVVRPILKRSINGKVLPFGNQGIGQFIRGNSMGAAMDNWDKVSYYKYGSYQLSGQYRSLVYFFVDKTMPQQGVHELYCFLINYTLKGKFISGILLGRTSKFTGYQVDITRQLPKQVLLVRNLGYVWDAQGKPSKKEYDVDHYYQIDAQGQIKDIQRKYYPYNGKFVDVGGSYIEVEQNKQHLFCTYWDSKSTVGRGAGNSSLNPKDKTFTMKIGKHTYKAEFAGNDTLVLNLPNGKIWVFKRRE
jgi:hypothetical protein